MPFLQPELGGTGSRPALDESRVGAGGDRLPQLARRETTGSIDIARGATRITLSIVRAGRTAEEIWRGEGSPSPRAPEARWALSRRTGLIDRSIDDAGELSLTRIGQPPGRCARGDSAHRASGARGGGMARCQISSAVRPGSNDAERDPCRAASDVDAAVVSAEQVGAGGHRPPQLCFSSKAGRARAAQLGLRTASSCFSPSKPIVSASGRQHPLDLLRVRSERKLWRANLQPELALVPAEEMLSRCDLRRPFGTGSASRRSGGRRPGARLAQVAQPALASHFAASPELISASEILNVGSPCAGFCRSRGARRFRFRPEARPKCRPRVCVAGVHDLPALSRAPSPPPPQHGRCADVPVVGCPKHTANAAVCAYFEMSFLP